MAKKKTGREVLAELRKEYNTDYDVIGTLTDINKPQQAYSTGNLGLDFLTGIGGFPKGKIVELHGPFSSGKSTSAFMAMAQEQKKIIKNNEEDALIVFLDYERSLDPKYCFNLGLDVSHDSFVYVRPDSLEQGVNLFRRLLETGSVRIACFDSVAAMVSEKEKNAETGAVTVADRAKALHQVCRQIKDDLDIYGTTAIFLNHTLEKVATDPMSAKMAARGIKQMTQPGGQALPFYASLRIEYKKTGQVKTKELDALKDAEDETVSGQKITATVVKNKTAAAFATTELRVRRNKGFSQSWSVLNVLVSHGVITAGPTGWYLIPERLVPTMLKDKVKDGNYKLRSEEAILKVLDASDEFLSLCEAEARGILEQFGLPRVDGTIYNSNGEIDEEALDALPVSENLGEFGENLS